MSMRRFTFAAIVCMAISFCYPLCAAKAIRALATTTWPKNFTINPGQTAKLSATIPTSGSVVVSVTWQGPPLAVGVQDALGNNLIDPDLKGSPVTATLPADEYILRRGTVWTVTVSLPASAERPASGQVNVQAPKALAPTIATTQRPTTIAPAMSPQRLSELLISGPPELLSVSAMKGKPGDTITLRARNIVPTGEYTQVNFEIAPGVSPEGQITGSNKNADGSYTLQVKVPDDPRATKSHTGSVLITSAVTDPVSTSSAYYFAFVPSPLPPNTSITSAVVTRLVKLWSVNTCTTPNSYISWYGPAIDQQNGLAIVSTEEMDMDTRAVVAKLTAYRVADGSVAWTKSLTSGRGEPLVAGGAVCHYITTGSPIVTGCGASTGGSMWSKPTQAPPVWLSFENGELHVYYPVYDTTAVAYVPRLHGVDPLNGNERWALDVGASASPPVFAGSTMYLVSNLGLLAIDNLKLPWRWQYNPAMALDNYTPAVAGGFAYVGGIYCGGVYAVNTATGTPAWKVFPKSRTGTSEGLCTGPIVANGVLYACTSDGKTTSTLRAYNATTGAEIWNHSLQNATWTTAVAARPRMFLVNDVIFAPYGVAIDTRSGSQLWKFPTGIEQLTPYQDKAILGISGGNLCYYAPQ